MNLFQGLNRLIGYARWPIRYKMLGIVIAAAVLPLLAFLGVQSVVRYQNLGETTEVVLEQQAQVASLLIDGHLNRLLTTLKEAGSEPRIQAYGITLALASSRSGGDIEANLVRAAMEEQLVLHPEIRAIRLLDPQGKLLVVTGPVAEMPSIAMSEQREHPAFAQFAGRDLSGANVFLLDPYLDPESRLPMFEAVSPLADYTTLYGYLVFSLDPDMELAQPLVEAQAASRDLTLENGILYVLDTNGRLLSPLGDLPLLTTELTLESVASEEEEAESARPAVYTRDWGAGPIQVMGRHRTVSAIGWTVVSEVPASSLTVAVFRELATGGQLALVVVVVLSLVLAYVTNRLVAVPIINLRRASEQLAAGNLDIALPEMERADDIGALMHTFSNMAEQVRASITELEHRVAERTRDLELATTIGREASSLRDLDTLLNYAITQIVQSFPKIYHAQIFLVDESRENALLVASTGEAGRELLRRGHALAVGSVSVIGRVTELGETVIARDTSSSRVHRRNEFLPDTRAEMALPLVHGDHVLGALDVQSVYPNAFNPDEQALFEALAAQLAIAIDNNRRLEASQQRMNELEAQNRLMTQQAWKQVLGGQRRGVLDAQAGAAPSQNRAEWSIWQHRAALQREVIVSPPDADGFAVLAVPILSRGEVLGVVEWQMPADRINANTQLLARELVERLSTTLETFRLLERTERQAERERLVNEISSRLTSEPNIPLILQAAVQQLSEVLGTSQVSIQLRQSDAAPANGRPDAGRRESN